MQQNDSKPSALDVQVGGDHYKKLKIQPMEYSMANGLDACQHTAIKYITRFRDKGGVADLEKAKHVIDMLIEFENEAQKEVAQEPLKPPRTLDVCTDSDNCQRCKAPTYEKYKYSHAGIAFRAENKDVWQVP